MKDPSRTARDVIARSSAEATARSAFCHSLVVSAGLLAAGCGQLSPPGEALNTPLNSTPTTVPPAASSSAAGWDGAYAGKGFLERDPGGTCETEMPVYGMRVAGTRVTFGSFSGTIGPDGSIDNGVRPDEDHRQFHWKPVQWPGIAALPWLHLPTATQQDGIASRAFGSPSGFPRTRATSSEPEPEPNQRPVRRDVDGAPEWAGTVAAAA